VTHSKGQAPPSAEEVNDFKRYFDSYYDTIRNFLYFKTGDADIADDFVQQVFMKLWEVRHTLRPDTVKPLLYAMAMNVVRNHFKHQKVVYNFATKQQDDNTSPEQADFEIQQREFNDKLTRVIEQIPDKSRSVFLMNRVEGLTYGEIAERMDLSVKAIEKRMHQALEIVKTSLRYKI
jgi:RNA polymerase sigma-70 factor (ECF subfamily)